MSSHNSQRAEVNKDIKQRVMFCSDEADKVSRDSRMKFGTSLILYRCAIEIEIMINFNHLLLLLFIIINSSIYLFKLFIYLSLFIYLFIYLSIYLSIYLFVYLFIYVFIYLFIL